MNVKNRKYTRQLNQVEQTAGTATGQHDCDTAQEQIQDFTAISERVDNAA